MVKVVSNFKTAAAEIVEVLHKNKIPLALIPTVYENVDQLIKMNTIPYSPSCLAMMDDAMSDITDSVTEPNG